MRIIAGKYKHRRFDVPHSFKARPTTDFAKEGLFNILSNVYIDFDDSPAALDLFCGTGSISLELLSRGCGKVVSVEKDFQHYQFISKTCRELGDRNWIPLHLDVFKYLEKCRTQNSNTFDLIFADPPYALEDFATIPDKVFDANILSPDGLFVLEHSKAYDFSSNPHFDAHRNYGSVNFTFFCNKE